MIIHEKMITGEIMWEDTSEAVKPARSVRRRTPYSASGRLFESKE